ncbi:hypothetical protein [Methylophaga sp. OBS3]|uniref:hypothetical protein n=1 Tax=Methylophaga sp. OBS3 TaxID=2991934 RepID=UPI00225BA66F|nr:hypothetical protein [Methylophaga sp. OBS3]MCX4188879.1 hypothetical protein [Methylophaga sp. OBS3]
MTSFFIFLIRAISSVVLFLLTLVLMTQEAIMFCKKRWISLTKPHQDPLAELKNARLPI